MKKFILFFLSFVLLVESTEASEKKRKRDNENEYCKTPEDQIIRPARKDAFDQNSPLSKQKASNFSNPLNISSTSKNEPFEVQKTSGFTPPPDHQFVNSQQPLESESMRRRLCFEGKQNLFDPKEALFPEKFLTGYSGDPLTFYSLPNTIEEYVFRILQAYCEKLAQSYLLEEDELKQCIKNANELKDKIENIKNYAWLKRFFSKGGYFDIFYFKQRYLYGINKQFTPETFNKYIKIAIETITLQLQKEALPRDALVMSQFFIKSCDFEEWYPETINCLRKHLRELITSEIKKEAKDKGALGEDLYFKKDDERWRLFRLFNKVLNSLSRSGLLKLMAFAKNMYFTKAVTKPGYFNFSFIAYKHLNEKNPTSKDLLNQLINDLTPYLFQPLTPLEESPTVAHSEICQLPNLAAPIEKKLKELCEKSSHKKLNDELFMLKKLFIKVKEQAPEKLLLYLLGSSNRLRNTAIFLHRGIQNTPEEQKISIVFNYSTLDKTKIKWSQEWKNLTKEDRSVAAFVTRAKKELNSLLKDQCNAPTKKHFSPPLPTKEHYEFNPNLFVIR